MQLLIRFSAFALFTIAASAQASTTCFGFVNGQAPQTFGDFEIQENPKNPVREPRSFCIQVSAQKSMSNHKSGSITSIDFYSVPVTELSRTPTENSESLMLSGFVTQATKVACEAPNVSCEEYKFNCANPFVGLYEKDPVECSVQINMLAKGHLPVTYGTLVMSSDNGGIEKPYIILSAAKQINAVNPVQPVVDPCKNSNIDESELSASSRKWLESLVGKDLTCAVGVSARVVRHSAKCGPNSPPSIFTLNYEEEGDEGALEPKKISDQITNARPHGGGFKITTGTRTRTCVVAPQFN